MPFKFRLLVMKCQKFFTLTKNFYQKHQILILVSSGGAGYDTIDVEACTKRGILVVNQTGGNAEAVAEHAVALNA